MKSRGCLLSNDHLVITFTSLSSYRHYHNNCKSVRVLHHRSMLDKGQQGSRGSVASGGSIQNPSSKGLSLSWRERKESEWSQPHSGFWRTPESREALKPRMTSSGIRWQNVRRPTGKHVSSRKFLRYPRMFSSESERGGTILSTSDRIGLSSSGRGRIARTRRQAFVVGEHGIAERQLSNPPEAIVHAYRLLVHTSHK